MKKFRPCKNSSFKFKVQHVTRLSKIRVFLNHKYELHMIYMSIEEFNTHIVLDLRITIGVETEIDPCSYQSILLMFSNWTLRIKGGVL